MNCPNFAPFAKFAEAVCAFTVRSSALASAAVALFSAFTVDNETRADRAVALISASTTKTNTVA